MATSVLVTGANRARCVVGAHAVGGILAESLAPTVVTDSVKAVGSGLRTLPITISFVG